MIYRQQEGSLYRDEVVELTIYITGDIFTAMLGFNQAVYVWSL
jgi:hypothetical protein